MGVVETSPGVPASLFGSLISGLVPTQGTDTDHDTDISTGYGALSDGTDLKFVSLSSVLTIAIDASAGEDSIDTGSVAADTWYHVWLYEKPSDGSIHGVYSLSATAPTLPDSATYKRRLGSVLTDGSSNIISYRCREISGGGVMYTWTSLVSDVAITAAQADGNQAITVPTGIVVRPLLSLVLDMNSAGTADMHVGDADVALTRFTTPYPGAYSNGVAQEVDTHAIHGSVFTNTSAEIRFLLVQTGGTIGAAAVYTGGWIDDRLEA